MNRWEPTRGSYFSFFDEYSQIEDRVWHAVAAEVLADIKREFMSPINFESS